MPEKKKIIEVDISIYPLEAIFGASYVFIDRAYIYLDSKQDGVIQVALQGKTDIFDDKTIAGEFMNELLNYVHRLNISKYNHVIRERVVERALYSSVGENLMDSDEEEFDDPLGIAVPWEEKYGDEKKNEK